MIVSRALIFPAERLYVVSNFKWKIVVIKSCDKIESEMFFNCTVVRFKCIDMFLIGNICIYLGILIGVSQITFQFSLDGQIDQVTCENWTQAAEASAGNCTKTGKKLHCFGGMTNLHLMNSQKVKKIEQVILCGWPDISFDPHGVLKHFPKIRVLRIEYSNLTHIVNDFPEAHYLESINISWTQFGYTRPTLFKRLHSLHYLDLRWNKLDHMEGPLILPRSFEQLLLSGNPWNCTKNLKWLLSTKGAHVADRENLTCTDYKYTGRHLLTVMQFKLNLKSECNHPDLRNCSCTMHHIRRGDDGKSLTPIYAVNCSHLNLYNFPSYLPENTSIFHATDNQISDVRSLRDNAVYRQVHDVYLDHNRVQTIDVLEAGFWLHSFRVFSLKGNKLTRLPVYALDSALEKNTHAARLYLSLNPWICDCKFTMKFRELLMKYHTIIRDSHNVTCKYIEGDDNFMTEVLTLERNDVCKLPKDSKILPLDLLNGVLASLIVLVLGKLAYDYYHYRKSGRLPWIVTKLP